MQKSGKTLAEWEEKKIERKEKKTEGGEYIDQMCNIDTKTDVRGEKDVYIYIYI